MSELQELYKTSPVNLAVGASPLWISGNGTQPKTEGIDCSVYQGDDINWHDVFFVDGKKFVAHRATVGNYYKDRNFSKNWQGSKSAGILTTAYIVVAPAWSKEWGDRKVSAQEHFDYFMDFVGGDLQPDLPIVLDCELSRNQSSEYIADLIADLAWMIYEQFGRWPLIYTRGIWWNENTIPRTVFELCDLWIARYNEALESPWSDDDKFRPRDWEAWHFWQYSEEGVISGIPNHKVDFDWWNGTLEDLLQYAEQEPSPPGPPPSDLEERVKALETLTARLEQDVIDLERELVALELRVTALEDVEPDPPPGLETITVRVKQSDPPAPKSDKAVAFYVWGYNKHEKPIMRKYLPVIRYNPPEEIEVYQEVVDADGVIDYYQGVKTSPNGTVIYFRTDKVFEV